MSSSSTSSSSGAAPTPLRYCDHCGSPSRALRKCTRCSLVGYCSKECQKSAWPRHEFQCQDAIDWQNEDKIYVEKPTGDKFNPSTPFKFKSCSDITSAEYDRVVSSAHSSDSKAMTTARSNSFRKVQARFGDEFTGLVPVLVTVDDVGAFARFDFFPLRRPRGLPPNLRDKEVQKRILDNARVLCRHSVNFGLPLGVAWMDQRYVYPGRFVQGVPQKRWEWRPLFEDWAMYEAYGRNAVIDAALNKFRSGLFVANVIVNVQRL